MGGPQAAGVLATVKRAGIERNGGEWSTDEEADFKRPILEQFETQGHPFYASARLWDDGIIDPRQTRQLLAHLLNISVTGDKMSLPQNTFGVARF